MSMLHIVLQEEACDVTFNLKDFKTMIAFCVRSSSFVTSLGFSRQH